MEEPVTRAHLSQLLVKGKSTAEAPEAWKALHTYIKENSATDDERGLAAVILLDQDKGIPAYVRECFHIKELAGVKKHIFQWIEELIRGLSMPQLSQHAEVLACLCKDAFLQDESNYVREAALLPLQQLVQARAPPVISESMSLSQAFMTKYERSGTAKLSASVKGSVLETLGYMLHAAPQAFDQPGPRGFSAHWLLDSCITALRQQGKEGKDQQQGLLAGALLGVNAALPHCEEGFGEGRERSARMQVAWQHVEGLIQGAASLSRYKSLHAALTLLANQAAAFHEAIMKDALGLVKALGSIKRLDSKALSHELLDAALSAVFQQAVDDITQQNATGQQQEASKQLLEQLLQQQVLDPISRPQPAPKEVAAALAGASLLAAPLAELLGPEAVESTLAAILSLHASTKNSGSGWPQDFGGYDAPMLAATAKLLRELPSGQEAVLPSCLELAERISAGYVWLWPKQRPAAHEAVQQLLLTLAGKPHLLHRALPQLVGSMLSHTLKPPEGRPGVQSSSITSPWKHSVHLWASLIGCTLPDDSSPGQKTPLSVDRKSAEASEQQMDVHRRVFDALMAAVLNGIRSLNLRYSSVVPPAAAGQADAAAQAAEPVLMPDNREDTLTFIELSGFSSAFLPSCPPLLFQPWSATAAQELTEASRQLPMLSGFYHMLKACLVKVQQSNDAAASSKAGSAGWQAAFKPYLKELCLAVRRYTDELLVACLQLLLSASPLLLPVAEVVQPLQQALVMGLQQPELAAAAVATLEAWEGLPAAAAQLHKVAPYVEPYLHPVGTDNEAQPEAEDEKESSSKQAEAPDALQASEKAAEDYRKLRGEARAAAQRAKLAREQGLAGLQPRVAGWLGCNAAAASCIATAADSAPELGSLVALPGNTGAQRWDVEDRFVISVHLPEAKQPIRLSLDLLLPQIAEVAESAVDRAAQVASCEFLHAALLWIIGTNAKLATQAKDERSSSQLHALLQGCLPVALRLAASEDALAQTLFRPLIMNLIHWLTSSAQREASDTVMLLDAIMEGLASPTGGSLRDLCAEATREFLEWSVRAGIQPSRERGSETGKAISSRTGLHAAALLKRLQERLTHPDAYTRLGAGLAAAKCVRYLRKLPPGASLAQEHVLELLRASVLGLQLAHGDSPGLGTCPQLADIIKEVVKLLMDRPQVLEPLLPAVQSDGGEGKADEPCPLEMFLAWLRPLTGTPQRYCRGVATWLMERLCEMLQASFDATAMADTDQGLPTKQWLESEAAEAGSSVQDFVSSLSPALLHVARLEPAAKHTQIELNAWLQALEASCHWAAWALGQGMISVDDLVSVQSQDLPEGRQHLGEAMQAAAEWLEAQKDDILQPQADHKNVQQMLLRLLSLLSLVAVQPLIDWSSAGVQQLLAAALLDPGSLSLPALSSVQVKSISLQAKAVLEAMAAEDKALLQALQPVVSTWLTGSCLAPAPEAASSDRLAGAGRQQTLQGLTAITELSLPLQQALLSNKHRQQLPDRLLQWAVEVGGAAGPQEQATGEAALQLAVRLGLQSAAMLKLLLNPERGPAFYHLYPSAVHAWVLWNEKAASQALCEACMQEGAAVDILCGTLASLQANRKPDQSADPRQRSYLQAIFAHASSLQSLVRQQDSDCADDQPDFAAASQLHKYLRVLAHLLQLDAAAVLAAAEAARSFLLGAYLRILSLRGLSHADERTQALQLLHHWLHLPAEQLPQVYETLAAMAAAEFPASSWRLAKGSVPAVQYRAQLLVVLDGLVAAAEAGADVTGGLQALASVLQETGDYARGHVHQQAVQLRLACIAAAPWSRDESAASISESALSSASQLSRPANKGTRPSNMDGENGRKQARALFDWAWRAVFEVHEDTPPHAHFRRAVLLYLLLPTLRFAPFSFQPDLLKQRIPHLLKVVHKDCPPGNIPGLRRNDEASGLVARAAAFSIFAHIYGSLPYEAVVKPDLAPLWGGNGRLMNLATSEVKSLSCSDEKLAEATRQACAAALAAAAALVTASQTQGKFFTAALAAAGSKMELVLNTGQQLDFSSAAGAYRRAVGSMNDIARQRKAARAARRQAGLSSVTLLGSVGTLGSLSSFSSASLSAADSSLSAGASQSSQEGDAHSSMQASLQASMEAEPSDAAQQPAEAEQLEEEVEAPQEAAEGLGQEEDELDAHACMLPLVRLVERAAAVATPDSSSADMPEWMCHLHSLISNNAVPVATRLFVARLVIHVDRRHQERQLAEEEAGRTPSVFARWHQHWLGPLIAVFCQGAGPHAQGLHYFLLDACMMLLHWTQARGQEPAKAVDTAAAAMLTRHLVCNAHDSESLITRNNFNLVKMFLGQWRNAPLPVSELTQIIAGAESASEGPSSTSQSSPRGRSADSTARSKQVLGLKILAVGVQYGRLGAVQADPDARLLKKQLLLCLAASSSQLAHQAGEAAGVILAQLKRTSKDEAADAVPFTLASFSTEARDVLRSVMNDPNRLARGVVALERLTAFHKESIDAFELHLFSALDSARLTGLQKAMVVDMLRRRADTLKQAGLLARLQPHLHGLVTSLDVGLQSSSLQLLAALLPDAPEVQIGRVLESLAGLSLEGPAQGQGFVLLRDAWQQSSQNRSRLRGPLLGLLSANTSADTRNKAIAFWHATLPKGLSTRLKDLLEDGTCGEADMKAKLEAVWPIAAATLLLELPKSADAYEQPLFSSDLQQCNFTDVSIDNRGQAMGVSAAVPLFSQEYLAASQAASQSVSQGEEGYVQATPYSQSQSMSMTLGMPGEVGGTPGGLKGSPPGRRSLPGGTSSDALAPQATVFRRPFRGEATQAAIRSCLTRNRAAAAAASEAGRRRKVVLMRRYRAGEMPDIRTVTAAALLTPLSMIAARNSSIARGTVTAFSAAAQAGAKDASASTADVLQQCFQRQPADPGYVACLQDLALLHRGSDMTAQAVASSGLQGGCLQGAALLLEEGILYGSGTPEAKGPPAKRQKRGGRHVVLPHMSDDVDTWAALAEVYQGLGEEHLMHVTYAQHIVRCPGTKQAMAARAARHTNKSFALYEALLRLADPETAKDLSGLNLEGFDGYGQPGWEQKLSEAVMDGQEPSVQEEDLWINERMRCVSTLGDWSTLQSVIDAETDGEAAKLLPGCSCQQYLRPYVQACLFQPSERQQLADMLQQPEHAAALHQNCATEMALLAASHAEWERCAALVGKALEAFQGGWAGLHVLSQRLRLHALGQLQPLAELQEALGLAKQEVLSWQGVADLAGRWNCRWPSGSQPQAQAWHVLVHSRELLLQSLAKACRQTDHQEVLALQTELCRRGARSMQQAGFLDSAQELLDRQVASVEKGSPQARLRTLSDQLHLRVAQAEQNPGGQSVLERVQSDLHQLQQAVQSDQHMPADTLRPIQVLQGSAHLCLAHTPNGEQDWASQHIAEAIGSFRAAAHRAAPSAAGSSSVAEDVAAASLKLAFLCNHLLQAREQGAASVEKLHAEVAKQLGQDGPAGCFVSSLLQAMHYAAHTGGGAELYVPRVLALLGSHDSACAAWAGSWQKVPVHLLLPWGPQMLSLLDAAEGAALLPVLKVLAHAYKSRLYFPYQLSRSTWSSAGLKRATELHPLMQSPLLEAFAQAVNDTTFPAQRWDAWTHQLSSLISKNDNAGARKLFRERAWPDMVGRHKAAAQGQGRRRLRTVAPTANAEFASKHEQALVQAFGADGAKLMGMDTRAFAKAASEVSGRCKKFTQEFMQQKKGRLDLASLSPWLANFSAGCSEGEQLMLPAMTSMQSVATGPPVDTAIVGFSSSVHVFSSKQLPKKLTIYADDFREYDWIVKGGEELRVDQRVEMLLTVMNGLLQKDTAATAHHLQVRTYDVVPMNESLGMVAFVPGTLPLFSVIKQSRLISKEDLNEAGEAFASHVTQASKTSSNSNIGLMYDSLIGKASEQTARTGLENAQACVSFDSLREVMRRYAGGAEQYFANRGRFIASLAALSVTGYIAGVGDRHLDNFLMHPASGRLIPIDFGYSFGTATQVLPVPELMPFRLTRQMAGAVLPHDVKAVLQEPCAAALSALRAGSDILEGILGSFLREPLLDWQREAASLQSSKKGGGNRPDADTISAHGELKIRATQQKLAGCHPSKIMITELQARHGSKEHWSMLQQIVTRAAGCQNRKLDVDSNLHSSEQASALLSMATSADILGRTWMGWRPWL